MNSFKFCLFTLKPSLILFMCDYWNMARERRINFLELIRTYAITFTSHHVLESYAGYSQVAEGRPSKCKYW